MTLEHLYKHYRQCKRVNTDSRKTQSGDLFVALRGENFNGNTFAEQALNDGARYALVDDPEVKKDDRYLLVDDCLAALQQLALHHRNQFNIPFIAIAGSNGKTTTKELMHAVLSMSYHTLATPGNFNNEIGLPLTLLRLQDDMKMAIIELGARHRGEIAELCEIARPTHGLITNIGKDHLETFGSIENTLKTNAELYAYLARHKGVAFLNIKYTDLMQEAESVTQKVTYGGFNKGDITGGITESFPFLQVYYHSQGDKVFINTRLVGHYNFENIMAAVAVGKHFGISNELIKRAIEGYTPSNNRSQVLEKDGNTFIMDAYNANPSSMNEALDSFHKMDTPNKVVILGDMLELGKVSYEEHLLIALKLKKLGFQQIVLVGDAFEQVKDKLNCLHFADNEAARQWFRQQHFTHHTFLLKGSRGIALEKILQ